MFISIHALVKRATSLNHRGSEPSLQFIWVLKQFYPDYAVVIDSTTELIDFYKEFYEYEMSVEDAEALLSCHHFYLHEALKDME